MDPPEKRLWISLVRRGRRETDLRFAPVLAKVYLQWMRASIVYTAFAAVVVLVACLSLAPACCAGQATGDGDRPLVLAASLRPNTRLMRASQYLYNSLFAQVGRRVELRFIPSVRAVREANQGYVDGDFFRIAAYGLRAPNLLRVDESVAQEGFGIYVASESFTGLRTLRDLETWGDAPLEIGYTRGIVGIDETRGVFDLASKHHLQPTPDLETGLQMLIKGRLDVFLGAVLAVEALLVQKGLMDSGIRCAGLFAQRSGYIFLHKRHAALIPGLEAAIRTMKTEGTYPDVLDIVYGTWPDDAVLDAAVPLVPSEPLDAPKDSGGPESAESRE